MATRTKTADKMRATLAKIADTNTVATPPVVQEIRHEAPKRLGRKKHLLEGVEYVRTGVKIPATLKDEMVVAMATTHRDYPTMDLFVAQAIRSFLDLKK